MLILRKALLGQYWQYAIKTTLSQNSEKNETKRMIVMSKSFINFLKTQLEEIFYELKEDNIKLKKMNIEKRRLYENILLGLDFKTVKETISAMIKDKRLQKQIIKEKKKKKKGWFFKSKITETISENEKLEIQNLIDKIVEENTFTEEIPDNYCHTLVHFNQRELRFDLRDGKDD
jgi:hypothetical protein